MLIPSFLLISKTIVSVSSMFGLILRRYFRWDFLKAGKKFFVKYGFLFLLPFVHYPFAH